MSEEKLAISRKYANYGLNSITRVAAEAVNEIMEKCQLNNISEVIIHMAAAVKDGQPIKGLQLEDAGRILLQTLDPEHRAWVEELSAQFSCPKWQIIMGAVSALIAKGQLQTVTIYNNWEGLESVEIDRATCKSCGKAYKPNRLGQLYCCNLCPSKQGGHNDDCTSEGSRPKIPPTVEIGKPKLDEVDPVGVPLVSQT